MGPEGKCSVCTTRAFAARDKEAAERILATLSPERRARFMAASAKSRGRVKPLPPRPVKPRSSPASAYERQRAKKRHALALEAWELKCATRAYNREKQRLKRLREIASADM